MTVRACDQCYFRVHDLCALVRTAPCATFRPPRHAGLAPPPQAPLIERPAAAAQPTLAARAS